MTNSWNVDGINAHGWLPVAFIAKTKFIVFSDGLLHAFQKLIQRRYLWPRFLLCNFMTCICMASPLVLWLHSDLKMKLYRTLLRRCSAAITSRRHSTINVLKRVDSLFYSSSASAPADMWYATRVYFKIPSWSTAVWNLIFLSCFSHFTCVQMKSCATSRLSCFCRGAHAMHGLWRPIYFLRPSLNEFISLESPVYERLFFELITRPK